MNSFNDIIPIVKKTLNKIIISVVIPCYGSEYTIKDVVLNCINTLKQRKHNFEIILVNDCSKDNVWNEIVELNRTCNKVVKGINLSKNFGQHAAIMAGFKECSGDVIVTLDDDGQTNPRDVWKLIDKLDEGYDVVFARYPNLKENAFRRFGSFINRKMAEILVDKPKDINGTSYIALKRFVLDDIIKYNNPYPYLGGLIYRTTQNIGEIEIEHLERKNGNSGYTLKKLVSLIMNGFTAFSVKPLRVSSYIGVLFAVIGFIYGLVIIIRKIVNPAIQLGYSSIMSILLFMGGIIMLMLGMIGEYIGRIYISINNSPQYVIKEKTK